MTPILENLCQEIFFIGVLKERINCLIELGLKVLSVLISKKVGCLIERFCRPGIRIQADIPRS